MKKSKLAMGAIIVVAGMAISSGVWAAWTNDKPIEIVVGFAPGGGTDTMTRTLSRFLEKNWVMMPGLLWLISREQVESWQLRMWLDQNRMAIRLAW